LGEALNNSNIKAEEGKLIGALVLLWHDHLDASHEIAQEIASATGAFIHGIMHRREPDFGNAAYWFRRVGKHPAFQRIAEDVGRVLNEKNQAEFKKNLVPGGEWDPFAFISACEQVTRSSGSVEEKNLLRELQAIESKALLEWIFS